MVSGFKDYGKYDGLGLADLVKTKRVKPGELVEEAISRIEKINPKLNAVITRAYDSARKAAERELPDGPFAGIPFLLKDLTATCAGIPMCKGSRFHKGFIPDHDSEMVKRFKKAGLIIVGKTNTPEYGLVPVTEPELFGPSNNPWDPARTTGGSSGGSAAAVSARIVPIAHGNDGGGSIRIPASCCGIFGFKPTRGRNPTGPDYGELWHGFVCDHVLTISVRDSAAMLDATAGPDIGAPYYAVPPSRPFLQEVNSSPGKLRIAFTSKPFLPAVVHDDCIKGLEATVKLCRELGHEMVEASPEIDATAFARAFFTMVCGETRADIEQAKIEMNRKPTARDFEPSTWVVGLLGKRCSASDFAKAIHFLKLSARQVGRFFQDYDVLLTPTLALPPVLTGALQPKGVQAVVMKLLGRLNAASIINAVSGIDALAEQVFSFMPFTPLFNATGQPAMSVPVYWNAQGLPIGMQFAGRYGDEATLFRLAGQLEKAVPWAERLPPFNAQND